MSTENVVNTSFYLIMQRPESRNAKISLTIHYEKVFQPIFLDHEKVC